MESQKRFIFCTLLLPRPTQHSILERANKQPISKLRMLTLDQRKFMFFKQSMQPATLPSLTRRTDCGDRMLTLSRKTPLTERTSMLLQAQRKPTKFHRLFGMLLIEVEILTLTSDTPRNQATQSTTRTLIHGFGSSQPTLWVELTDLETPENGPWAKKTEGELVKKAWSQTLTCLPTISLTE